MRIRYFRGQTSKKLYKMQNRRLWKYSHLTYDPDGSPDWYLVDGKFKDYVLDPITEEDVMLELI